MRLVSFNMRTGSTSDWEHLLALEPDVAFLQESHGPDKLTGDLFARVPLDHVIWRAPAHGRWGTALLLPEPPVRILEVPGYEGWVVGAETRFGASGPTCSVFSIHVPQRHSGYVRTVDEILDGIASLELEGPLVLGGDLNVATARRVPHEERTTSRGELRLLDRIEDSFGLVNGWVVAHPNTPLAQTLRWARNPETPYHCDGVFIPAGWAARVRTSEVLQGQPWLSISDHNPVVVELAL